MTRVPLLGLTGMPQLGRTGMRLLRTPIYLGDLFVGGTFTTIGGVPASRIAAWNDSYWYPPGSGVGTGVEALGVYDGKLIATGSFTTAGGGSASRIAQWDGTSWAAMGSGLSSTGRRLLALGGDLIVAGNFTAAGGVSGTKYLARWTGSSYTAIGGGVTDTGFGSSAIVGLTQHAGKLVVCGGFWEIGGVAANHIAGWDGSAWSPFPGFGTLESVHECRSFGGKLYAGRAFGTIYVWEGSSWTHMDEIDSAGTYPRLHVHAGKLYLGGPNTMKAGGVATQGMAVLDGDTWKPMPGGGPGISCNDITTYKGNLVAVGSGGVKLHDGSSWTTLATTTASAATVYHAPE